MRKERKTVRFHLTISSDLDDRLLAWRKAQPGYLNRSDAVRKMIERVLDEDEKNNAPKH
jgi:metal-responsive CopG/Arc/MetJ family transcriptional regulator